jgi:MFS family permease
MRFHLAALDHGGMETSPATRSGPDRRWLILGVIGIAQLMVILDLTVMNIALPSAQRALDFTTADRQWVVTAYTLAFGSLLLLGGRLADLLGRKVTFLTGLVGFAGVSAIGGASVNFTMLVTARACQGAFAALLVPSALSLLTTTFTEPKDRGKAFGVYGAIAAAGGGVGLLLGGALTEYLSWRWCLYVNLLFAGVAFIGGAVLLKRQPSPVKPRLDVPVGGGSAWAAPTGILPTPRRACQPGLRFAARVAARRTRGRTRVSPGAAATVRGLTSSLTQPREGRDEYDRGPQQRHGRDGERRDRGQEARSGRHPRLGCRTREGVLRQARVEARRRRGQG